MSSDLTEEPLDPDIAALLDRERSAPALGRDRRAALVRRLEHAAMSASAVGAAAAVAATHGTGPSAALEPARRAVGWGLGAKVGLASTIFLAGGAVGSFIASPRAPVTVAAPVASSSVVAEAAPPAASAPPASVRDDSTSSIPVVSVDRLPRIEATPPPLRAALSAPLPLPSSSSTRVTSLAEEERLLDTARAAVARQAYAAALTALAAHEAHYAHGKLEEERELLYVEALAGSGDTAKATNRALAFERRFPSSIFLPAVRAASATKER